RRGGPDRRDPAAVGHDDEHHRHPAGHRFRQPGAGRNGPRAARPRSRAGRSGSPTPCPRPLGWLAHPDVRHHDPFHRGAPRMTTTDETTAELPRFSAALRDATWQDHEQAESSTFVKALMGAELPIEGYANLAAQQ